MSAADGVHLCRRTEVQGGPEESRIAFAAVRPARRAGVPRADGRDDVGLSGAECHQPRHVMAAQSRRLRRRRSDRVDSASKSTSAAVPPCVDRLTHAAAHARIDGKPARCDASPGVAAHMRSGRPGRPAPAEDDRDAASYRRTEQVADPAAQKSLTPNAEVAGNDGWPDWECRETRAADAQTIDDSSEIYRRLSR